MNNQIYLFVLDQNFNKIGIIDNYNTLIWTARYYEHGDFEITIGLNESVVSLLVTGNYIARDDDENVGIIEKIEVSITNDNKQTLIASGRFLTQILERRIVAQQTQVSGTVAACINKLINDAIINPAITARKISNFTLGSYSIASTMSAQFTGDNLYTLISDVCVQYGLGLKVTLNDSNQFVFELYEGTDRSYDQTINPYVVFSDQFENLVNADYVKDISGVVTAVLAAGEGEGLARKTIWVTSDANPTGLNRYEFYDDSRNTSSNEGEISEQDYLEQLAELGRESLTMYEMTFGGEVDFTNIDFKTDLNLGDICTIENKKLGLAFSARIIEVIESIDASGKYQLIPTFGK